MVAVRNAEACLACCLYTGAVILVQTGYFLCLGLEKMPVMVLEVGESPGRLRGVGAPNGAELEGVGDVERVEMRLIWPWHRVEMVGREVAASWRGWGCFGCSIS